MGILSVGSPTSLSSTKCAAYPRELPETLDETYERILKEIKKPNRGHARRVLQCLVVAIRPLRVAELAEVLAVDFDDARRDPKLKTDWRWEDQEQALLIPCSSLISIVEADRFAGCPILAFFGQGIPDLVSARCCKWRGLELSYRFGARAYDAGASLPRRVATNTL